MLVEVFSLPLGPIGTNCYVIGAPGSRDAVVVDPGGDATVLLDALSARVLSVAGILVTHCHWDHIGAVAEIAASHAAEVWMSSLEAEVLENPSMFPLGGPEPITPAKVTHRLDGTERFALAGITFDTIHVPGHSPGHLAFVIDGVVDASGDGYDAPPVCLIGDVIFQGSVGRTDLPFADGAQLAATIDMLKVRLHPDTVLLPGHGNVTTMAAELASNPFLR